jgi:hypothetical protein
VVDSSSHVVALAFGSGGLDSFDRTPGSERAMHTARSAQHTALVGLAAFVVSVAASAQGPGPVQFPTEFSTHDYTSTSNATTFHEMWADVKTPGSTMPGEGRTYSVGTIEIHEATESPSLSQFSFRDVELPPSPARPFIIQSGMTFQTKQVAILQVSGRDPDPQGVPRPQRRPGYSLAAVLLRRLGRAEQLPRP